MSGPFFAFCLALVAVWLQGVVTILVTGQVSLFLDDKFQLEINTTTTIITFLLVGPAAEQREQGRPGDPTQAQRHR